MFDGGPRRVIALITTALATVFLVYLDAMRDRIASEAARFGFVFSRRGIVPEAASSWFLPRIVGIGQALEWVYSGRVFSAQEALAQNNLVPTNAEITQLAKTSFDAPDLEAAMKVVRLMEAIDDHDDVQNVYSNLNMTDEVMAELGKE